MNRTEREFRRSVTRRVRGVVQASPVLQGEQRQRSSQPPWSRIVVLAVVWIAVALFYVLVAPTMISLLVCMPLVIWMLGDSRSQFLPHADYALASITLALTAAVALTSGLAREWCLCHPPTMRRMCYFPVPDRGLLWPGLSELLKYSGAGFCCLILAYAAIAVHEKLSAWEIVAFIALLLLQWGHLLAMVVAIGPQVKSRSPADEAIFCFMMLSGFLAPAVAVGIDKLYEFQHWIGSAVLATPAGWVHGAIAYGLIGGQWWGWLFLVPVSATFWLAYSWWRRGYSIREVRIDSTGEATPVFEWGLPNDPSIEAVAPPARSANATGATQVARESPEEAAARARKKILGSDLLRPADWSQVGFIERLVARHCTARELVILKQHFGRPCWTRAWWIAALTTLVPLVIRLVVANSKPDLAIEEPRFTIALWLLVLPVAEFLAYFTVGEEATGGSASHPLFPVDMQATLGVKRRLAWIRVACWLPLFAVVSLILSVGYEDWLGYFVSNMLIAVALCGVVRIWLMRPAFFGGAMPDFSWQRVGVLTMAALAIYVFPFWLWYIHWTVTTGLIAWTLVTDWLLGLHCDRLYHKCDFDARLPREDKRRAQKALAPAT